MANHSNGNKRAYFRGQTDKDVTGFRKASDKAIKEMRESGRLIKVTRIRGV